MFFGRKANDSNSLNKKYLSIVNNYNASIEKTKRFSQFHLSHGSNGLSSSVTYIDNILKNQHIENVKPL